MYILPEYACEYGLCSYVVDVHGCMPVAHTRTHARTQVLGVVAFHFLCLGYLDAFGDHMSDPSRWAEVSLPYSYPLTNLLP